jgi:hypothetical protein
MEIVLYIHPLIKNDVHKGVKIKSMESEKVKDTIVNGESKGAKKKKSLSSPSFF